MKDFLTALLLACAAVCIGLSTHAPSATAATASTARAEADRPTVMPAPSLDEVPEPPRSTRQLPGGPIDTNID